MYDKFIKVGYVGQASGIPGTMAASGGAWCLEGAADPAGQSGKRKNLSNLCNDFLRIPTRQLVAVIWMRSRKIHKGSHGRMGAPAPDLHITHISDSILSRISWSCTGILEWFFPHPKKTRSLVICRVVDITQVLIAGAVTNTLLKVFGQNRHEH